MNGINEYQVFQSEYGRTAAYTNSYEKTGARKTGESGSAKEVNDKRESVELSDDAKDLLKRLKKKYGNMDFVVANYSSDEEAQRYLAGGTKDYSVLIEPEVLEKMAADEETEKKYTGMIDEATGKLDEMKKELGDDDTVARLGVSFGKDGSVSYFAELEKSSEKQRERIDKSRADKKEKAAKDRKVQERKAEEERLRGSSNHYEQVKRTRVTADSTEELLEKKKNVDWDKIRPEQRETVGGIFNYGI